MRKILKSLFKEKLTERTAATLFVATMAKEVNNIWPILHQDLKDMFGKKIIIENKEMASIHLMLAAIAQGLQTVNNLFPPEQAKRIESWVFNTCNEAWKDNDFGKEAINEIRNYGKEFQDAIKNIEAGGNPLTIISAIFVQRLLGKNVHKVSIKIKGEEYINPILVTTVTSRLISLAGFWKNTKTEFKLIEGNMP